MREVDDHELTEAANGMLELNRNWVRHQKALDGMVDWPEIAEDDADHIVQLMFAAATALDELASEVEGFKR